YHPHPLFYFNHPPSTSIYTLSLHDALPIFSALLTVNGGALASSEGGMLRSGCASGDLSWFSSQHRSRSQRAERARRPSSTAPPRSEEHTSELQSQSNLVCRLLLEKKKNKKK